ncbi:MAG: ASCH domain-containing protein [Zymomonas mobilis]|uniref:ASCH domain-containing ribonuclease n=2 Tax=Zymomonas mobilis subsp. mobilis (strain ATCC 10988 / DSM 424 / LMG 404 / NCIMB 8938 / NRRL B-806 / ZM1) TaxID=555217 RepID=ASCHD_ZYMMA|nr:ASCH domain-containing protein [Zymomonas mobilis]A0A0H3G0N3.1 RecName: Full=ASCH domain-containing ribonuclease; Short=ZmASCH [Zymomonas mobilis subsp. mobilis ATCC 10988]5GUS_A Chain A, Helix-turn-helix domain-containing protein [Zymomonas mobilis subsp. mobilis ATCC 10988]5GUS_B Chain B, Helix-turn-helix domain-containing protein [Zymomonas mobilis subsp. mobilis ATCC 10988]ACV74927.1 helix-turn-helix domain-containing protein [Zymomonas mobilis subsp. mobilis NCIMB 11163]AEH62228.1 heli
MTDIPDRKEAVISLWPEFAKAIVSGKKTVEFRRRIPLPALSARIWIYATRPVKSVIGFAYLEAIVQGDVNTLWSRYGREAFLSEQQYRDYFEGTEKATAFLLRDHQPIRPINLDQLKEIRANFQPPQSLTWLRKEETQKLVSLTSQVE